MPQKHYPKGLDGRMRDENGQIRQKRSDTETKTIRKIYPGFAHKYRSDATLGTILRKEGAPSLSQFLKKMK